MPERAFRVADNRRRPLLVVMVIALALVVSVACLRNSGDKAPAFPEDFFPNDVSAALQADLDQAKKRIERSPGAVTWGAMGELCMAHELLPQAKYCFTEASLHAPEEPKWIYLQSVIAEEVDIPLALEGLMRIRSLNPDLPAFYLRLGKLQARAGLFSDAEDSLERALQLSSDHPQVLAVQAQLLVMQEKTEAAGRVYLRIQQDHRTGHDLMVTAQNWLERNSGNGLAPEWNTDIRERPPFTATLEEPWLAGVVSRVPKVSNMAVQAGTLATAQEYDAAIRIYNQLIRTERRNSRSHAFRAMVLMNAGQSAKSLEEISRVCRDFPGDALAWSCRGAIEVRNGQYEEAIESLRTAVRIKPDFVDAHRALLQLFRLREMQGDALRQFEILKVLRPGDQSLNDEYSAFISEHPHLKVTTE